MLKKKRKREDLMMKKEKAIQDFLPPKNNYQNIHEKK